MLLYIVQNIGFFCTQTLRHVLDPVVCMAGQALTQPTRFEASCDKSNVIFRSYIILDELRL